MKIGVLLIGYNMEEHVNPCLWPWVNASNPSYSSFGQNHQIVICAASVPFIGYPVTPPDRTREYLRKRVELGEVGFLIESDTPQPETEVRSAALRWLLEQQVDIVIQVDLDEAYTIDQIARIISFVESNPHITWFRLSFRNAVFSPTTYLADPFTPPRIYRARAWAYKAHSFYQDNNIRYGGTITRDLKQDDYFASMTIPKEVAWIKHVSWLSDIRSKQKVEYQQHRWGPPIGAGCMFAWDSVKGLVWNDEYFKLTGQPYPDLISG